MAIRNIKVTKAPTGVIVNNVNRGNSTNCDHQETRRPRVRINWKTTQEKLGPFKVTRYEK